MTTQRIKKFREPFRLQLLRLLQELEVSHPAALHSLFARVLTHPMLNKFFYHGTLIRFYKFPADSEKKL